MKKITIAIFSLVSAIGVLVFIGYFTIKTEAQIVPANMEQIFRLGAATTTQNQVLISNISYDDGNQNQDGSDGTFVATTTNAQLKYLENPNLFGTTSPITLGVQPGTSGLFGFDKYATNTSPAIRMGNARAITVGAFINASSTLTRVMIAPEVSNNGIDFYGVDYLQALPVRERVHSVNSLWVGNPSTILNDQVSYGASSTPIQLFESPGIGVFAKNIKLADVSANFIRFKFWGEGGTSTVAFEFGLQN